MEFWKNGLLPFDPAKITTDYVVGEDETEYPNFERVLLRKSAKYHHNYHIRYLPYNLARKKKSLRSKNKKDEAGKSSAFFLSSMGSKFLYISSWAIPNPICIICGDHDVIENFHAARAFHTSKSKLNSEHVIKLTNNGRDIAVYIGDNTLVNRLILVILVLAAHFTTNVAQLTYTVDLQKSRKKNVREKLILTMQKQQLGTRWLHLWTRLYHQLLKKILTYMS